MDQTATCNVKGVTCSEPTKNYHRALQFLAALLNILASFGLLFWFCGLQFTVLVQHLAAQNPIFLSEVGGDQNRAKRKVNIGLPFIRWPEARLQMTANVSPFL